MFLAIAGCGRDFELPPLVASSEYIAYHTDADASVICVDDFLVREDRFIERTATLLGVDPPLNKIDFVWNPVVDGSEPWACPPEGADCYMHREEDDLSVVVSRSRSNHHEVVHAVEIQALGDGGNRTLQEGLAEYLGTRSTTAFDLGDFPGAFKAMIAEGPRPSDYRLAMHFVGSIFVRHGAAGYRALRAKMPAKVGVEKFAEVFEMEYGQSLDDALVEMSGQQVYAIDLFDGCGDGEARELDWTAEGLIETTLEGSCGDPWFVGTGFVDGREGFYGLYVVEVPEGGYYELTVGGVAGDSALVRAFLSACSFAMIESQVPSFGGATGKGLLQPGRHMLQITFPPGPQARGEATIRLELVAPPP